MLMPRPAGINAGPAAILVLLGLACGNPAFAGNDAPLDAGYLESGKIASKSFAMSRFGPSLDAVEATAPFAGRLLIASGLELEVDIITDQFGILADTGKPVILPVFDFTFEHDGGALLPTLRTPVANSHILWEWIVSPGRVWREPGEAMDRAMIPFGLMERNANCLHYGVLTFLYDERNVSQVASQISSETCRYLQFNARGLHRAEVAKGIEPSDDLDGDEPGEIIHAREHELAARLPTRTITAIGTEHSGADPAAFGSVDEVPPEAMSAYGVVIDGIHYVSTCRTRHGPYPNCDDMPLPSYSLAKSMVASLALMRAERLYPGARNAEIRDYVDACHDEPAWKGVTIGHALDMATGNYNSDEYQRDEDRAIDSDFFITETHEAKIRHACNAYRRKAEPGTRWVYHTSDTYLAGTALAGFLREQGDPAPDLYDDLIVRPLWHPLSLSPLIRVTRRTHDDVRQPFTGWGLALLRDDIARIGVFLNRDGGRIDGATVLDSSLFDAAMQRDPDDRGLPTDVPGLRYNAGFWAYDVAPHVGCPQPVHVPLMSGYGGIIVTLFPNDMVYYYVSDGGTHRWLAAAREAHRLRSFCKDTA